MLIGPAAKDGSSDTFILKNGEKKFSSFERSVSDSAIVAPSAVSIKNRKISEENDYTDRIYVLATASREPGKMIFRATDYKAEPSEYSNEWVNGRWYNKAGYQMYRPAASWKHNRKGWWYEDTSGWYPKARWQKIDGKWYYFDETGYLVTNAWIKGCWVGKDGAWTYPYRGKWYRDSEGWWYEDESGWYPKNRTMMIDGKQYSFDKRGYCTNP